MPILLTLALVLTTAARAGDYVSPLEALEKWKKNPTERLHDSPFISYPAAAPYYAVGYDAGDPSGHGLLFDTGALYRAAGTGTFRAEDLRKWITEKKIGSVEALFASSEQRDDLKGYRDHRAYVYRSFSRQQHEVGPTDIASGEKATNQDFFREIHYSPTGNLIFAFPTKRSPDGKKIIAGDELEVLVVQKDFSLKPFQVKFASGHGDLTDANSCARCHGADKNFRLNSMGTYNLWAGMVAGLDDNQDRGAALGNLPENRYLAQHLAEDRTKGTLALASWPKETKLLYPTGMRANLMFHQYAHTLQYKKLALQLTNAPFFEHYQYAILAAFERCENLPSFLPEGVAARHEARLGLSYDHLWRDTQLRRQREFEERRKIFKESNRLTDEQFKALNAVGTDYESESEIPLKAPKQKDLVTDLRFLIEGERLDPAETMKYWSLSFKPKTNASETYSYSFDGESSSEGLKGFYHFALKPLLADRKLPTDCGELKMKSLAVLTKAYRDLPADPAPKRKNGDH